MRVLVIDPQDASRAQMRKALAEFELQEASRVESVRQGDWQPSAIVAAAELLDDSDQLLALAGKTPVVLVAEAPSIPHAVDCMRRGAADYLPRPLASGALAAAVRRCIGERAQATKPPAQDLGNLLGDSPPMRELGNAILALDSDSPVLVEGEPGSGKTLVAHAIHTASKRQGQFISLDCAAVPDSTIAARLFGNDAAETPTGGLASAAQGGTLFLHAIGELPMAAQAKLLSALRNGGDSTTLRLIASTRTDLAQLAQNGHFHADLLDLLSAFVLRVPPLRDRGDDAQTIATAVLERTSAKLNKQGLRFADAALAAMRSHPWPGNVRELKNAVERAASLCRGYSIDCDLLGIPSSTPLPRDDPAPTEDAAASEAALPATSGSLESFFLRFVLDNQDRFTETELATQLGISRKSLWERRQRLNIPRRRTHKRGPR